MAAKSTKPSKRHLNADHTHLTRLLKAVSSDLQATSPEGKTAILFLIMARDFTAITGKAEVVMLDVLPRLIGQMLAELDVEAARGYLEGLADYSAAGGPAEKEDADERMRAHFIMLQSAFALVDNSVEGVN